MGDQARSKSWGYEVERQAEKHLKLLWPRIHRTGTSYQKTKGFPDLWQPNRGQYILAVVTKDKGRDAPLLITLRVADLLDLVSLGSSSSQPVAIQVKGRQSTWIGSLWRELRDNATAWLEFANRASPAPTNMTMWSG